MDTNARYCAWCRQVTHNAQPVRLIHQNTGPGFTIYACGSCRSIFRLRALVEEES